ncbi:MAG: acyl-[acyl-carrier-protein]--UDP-N-acetylglucosamine O-acyltransferase [Planctomycetes bacterium RBG_16_64_10]|nr:MAG: acyl-[acyl-carrier-protein]--UDP-N-acetylglucosamine O-acyltransferase [Planctomycetes bacterium RBG_16_64_10]
MPIHPYAIVSPQAELGRDVVIGPFCVIEPDAVLGDGCQLASHVMIKRGSILGSGNQVFEGAVIGGLPQHSHMPERPGTLTIGNDNVIREYCTLHRSLYQGSATELGNRNLLMVSAHVAHDCRVGDGVILTNGALLGGHVEVHDRAYVSGAAAVHQFCRIGRHAMVGGHARVLKDVPPFVTVDGGTGMVVGLNSIGLQRAGFGPADMEQLKAAYRLIYRQGLIWHEVLDALAREFPDGPAAEFLRFFSAGTRGFTPERRSPPGATIKLHRATQPGVDYSTKVG